MALPLLALGRTALAAVGRGKAAKTAGFKDILKESTQMKNNVLSFKTGKTLDSDGAGQASTISRVDKTTSSTNRVAGDIQAATELSMDELAKQTKLLDEIKQNTQQTSTNTQGLVAASSGAAPAPPSEEEIKGRFGKTGAVLANIGKKADEKIPMSLSAFMGAIAGMSLTNPNNANTREATEAKLTAKSGADRSQAFGALLTDGGGRMDKVSDEEIAANKGKRDAIVKRIERANLSPEEQAKEIANLDSYFERGNEESVQAVADKYRMVGDEDTGAYQFRKSAAKFGVAEAEKFAASLGEEGAGDLEKFKQQRAALENNPEELAKIEKEFRDRQLALRTASEKRMSEELYAKGFLGTQTAGQKKEMQLEQVEDKVAASMGNDGFFASAFEGAKRFGGNIFGYETEQEQTENAIKSKMAFTEAEMREAGASERDIINMRKDMLAQIQSKIEEIPEATPTRPSADTLGSNSQESKLQEQAAMAASMGAATGGNTVNAVTPDSKANQPVDATALLTDPSTKDSVGNMLKKLNDMRSLGAM